MSKFNNTTKNFDIEEASNVASRLLYKDSAMMKEILNKDDFKYNSGLGIEVYSKIVKCEIIAPIKFYRPFNPWTKAMGYSDGKAIYLNSRKFDNFSYADLVGLLCHEWLHIGPRFSHGNNYPSDEKNKFSVPYFVSHNIDRWL